MGLGARLPVLQYGHLSYGYEIDPEPPGPSKDSKTKDAGVMATEWKNLVTSNRLIDGGA